MGNLINPGMYTSATEEWETPDAFFKALDARFRFTLDACATKKNHKCDKYYTKEEDGLAQDWGGERVWINPPYGREISKWIQKAEEEAQDYLRRAGWDYEDAKMLWKFSKLPEILDNIAEAVSKLMEKMPRIINETMEALAPTIQKITEAAAAGASKDEIRDRLGIASEEEGESE